jgi:hypothetical protein
MRWPWKNISGTNIVDAFCLPWFTIDESPRGSTVALLSYPEQYLGNTSTGKPLLFSFDFHRKLSIKRIRLVTRRKVAKRLDTFTDRSRKTDRGLVKSLTLLSAGA